MDKYAIKRPINGISLNGSEYLLNDAGGIKTFLGLQMVLEFCKAHGISVKEIEIERI